MVVNDILIMQRKTFFGFDPNIKQVFVFLFENNRKVLSLFIEYLDEETLKISKQDLGLYGLFWESGSSIEEIISLFKVNLSIRQPPLKRWHEEA